LSISLNGVSVLREIPERFVRGVAEGSLNTYGGIIKDVGTGKIVGHLQVAGPEVLQGLGQSFSPLAGATLALGAANLLVSVVGFAVVCSKLNAIDRKLDTMTEMLTSLLEGQRRMAFEQELRRRTDLAANLKNLERGLRTEDDTRLGDALNRLTETGSYYQGLSEFFLQDFRQLYHSMAPWKVSMEMVLTTTLAQAQVEAFRGNPQEALRLLEELLEWHQSQEQKLFEPVQQQPLWLAKLSTHQVEEGRQVLSWTKQLPEGLEYSRQQYKLCRDYNLSPRELGEQIEREELLFLERTEGPLLQSSSL
jgi:hypothetical protein